MKMLLRALALTATMLAAVVVPGDGATAQTTTTCAGGGYPPCQPQAQPSSGTRDFGVFRSGEAFDKVDCGFDAGSSASTTFNGAASGTTTVGSDGCTRFNVAVGPDQRVTFNGRSFTGRCGANTLVVSAPAAGATRTVTNTFTIACAAAAGATTARTGAETAGMVGGGVALVAAGGFLILMTRRRRRQPVPA